MAGPKEDWLMWDRRFQLGYGVLNQRLKINEEATQQITQLVQQNKNLASSIKHLQEDNDGLRDRIQQLEKQASHKHAQLDEQIQDLTASSGNFKDENKDLNDRILQLKQEGTHRDQQNRLIQGQLKEKLEALEDGFQSVDLAMKEMNGIARLEREQRGKEIQQLRSQIEALVVTRHTSGRHARDTSSEMSQANTVEDRMPVNQLLKMQLQPNAGHQDLEKQGVLIRAQSSSTLFENHLKYTEKAVRLYETEAVQLFVRGVQAKHRIPLGNKLEERDEWTWQAVMEEGYGMVEAEKKMKRRSGRHLNGSSQPW